MRGRFAGHCPVTPETVCQQGLHFQDLRPQPDGSVRVISTSQAFTLPTVAGTYSFTPEDMFVAQGAFLGLAKPGGEWEVLVSSAASTTDMFVGHELDNNGDQFQPTATLAGKELNMQATVQP